MINQNTTLSNQANNLQNKQSNEFIKINFSEIWGKAHSFFVPKKKEDKTSYSRLIESLKNWQWESFPLSFSILFFLSFFFQRLIFIYALVRNDDDEPNLIPLLPILFLQFPSLYQIFFAINQFSLQKEDKSLSNFERKKNRIDEKIYGTLRPLCYAPFVLFFIEFLAESYCLLCVRLPSYSFIAISTNTLKHILNLRQIALMLTLSEEEKKTDQERKEIKKKIQYSVVFYILSFFLVKQFKNTTDPKMMYTLYSLLNIFSYFQ